MAKRELSSTLKNLKFMQRAAHREEKAKKEEVRPEGNFLSLDTVKRKCVVIMEGDPHPGAVIGRMSFQSFNPSIDKLHGEAANLHQQEANATCSLSSQIGRNSLRENGSSEVGAECSKADKLDANGDLKRKQSEVESEQQYPNKSPKNVQAGQEASPSNHQGSRKQEKREKLDWNVLRPPKFTNKKGEQN